METQIITIKVPVKKLREQFSYERWIKDNTLKVETLEGNKVIHLHKLKSEHGLYNYPIVAIIEENFCETFNTYDINGFAYKDSRDVRNLCFVTTEALPSTEYYVVYKTGAAQIDEECFTRITENNAIAKFIIRYEATDN